MGRKSSAKAQSRPTSPTPPPPEPGRSFTPFLAVAIAALVIVGVFAYTRTAQQNQAAESAPTPAQTVAEPPAAAALGPHPQANLPPLPFDSSPPARPAEVVREVYTFAAEHPEVLSYVPCYCGCERSGHRGNEDCFVTTRDTKGDVTQWEPHGMT